MKNLMFLSVSIIVAAVGVSARAGQSQGESPVIESIEGDKVVVVRTPAGNRVGTPGTPVNVGDKVRTGPKASAKIRYPDGSKLLIGRGTEMEVQESNNGTQYNELSYGQIRGIIKKPKIQIKAAPPRFMVRSKAAVMGVRGTDFVFSLDDAAVKSQIHTLDGVVEVAKDEKVVMSGQGVPVRRDQFVKVDEKAIAPPEKFNHQQFVSTLEAAQPEFVALVKNDPDAVSKEENPSWETVKKTSPLHLLAFQVGGVYCKQEGGGELTSVQFGWTPSLRIFGPFGIRGLAGVTPMKGQLANDRFFAVDVGLLASFSLFNPLIIEAGVGVQKWTSGHGSTEPTDHVGVSFRLSEDRFIERIYVGVSRYHFRTHWQDMMGHVYDDMRFVHEVKAGIGFQF